VGAARLGGPHSQQRTYFTVPYFTVPT
jgi:hypothetical protein